MDRTFEQAQAIKASFLAVDSRADVRIVVKERAVKDATGKYTGEIAKHHAVEIRAANSLGSETVHTVQDGDDPRQILDSLAAELRQMAKKTRRHNRTARFLEQE